jgi:hypothetical protein
MPNMSSSKDMCVRVFQLPDNPSDPLNIIVCGGELDTVTARNGDNIEEYKVCRKCGQIFTNEPVVFDLNSIIEPKGLRI